MKHNTSDIIEETINLLSCRRGNNTCEYLGRHEHLLPNIDKLRETVDLLRSIMFPGYFGAPVLRQESLPHFLGVRLEKLQGMLAEQIPRVLHFGNANHDEAEHAKNTATIVRQFIEMMPEIKRRLCTDVRAIYDGDPAAKSYEEIIFCYPSIRAVINYRVAHALLSLGVPLIPRIITEMAHSETGIDIHPGAHIGDYFCIDHGTGVVIGETCIIGNHVRIYQGVTLGAKKFETDEEGHLVKDLPRHPIIEDNVVIYANATVLGRITIGKNSVIGGSVWQTKSLPPHSKVLQQTAEES
uniref:serine O-acetyltransferase n=1 Tax=Chlorobium chlorochromatii (strain CaD3) TaxID=340177 RepID=Q3AR53_CHLCH